MRDEESKAESRQINKKKKGKKIYIREKERDEERNARQRTQNWSTHVTKKKKNMMEINTQKTSIRREKERKSEYK